MPPPAKKHSLPHPSPSNPHASPSLARKTSRTDPARESISSSSAIRKKSTSNAPARTGQACDRCKLRKIRCDNTLGGCIPCRQNNTECKSTDRITHRATARGHTEVLERENSLLTRHLKDLEQQIIDLGGTPRSFSYYSQSADSYGQDWSQASASQGQSWPASAPAPATSNRSSYSETNREKPISPNVFPLPVTLPEGTNDHYLGLSTSGNLSQAKGTSLSLFGMHLDLTDFMSDAAQDSNNPRSYAKLFEMIRVGMHGGVNRPDPPLPTTYAECMQQVEMFIAFGTPGQPLIHAPAIRDLVSKIYYQAYEPTPTEHVIIHSMLAGLKYQFSVRNDDEQARAMAAESNAHYHFALTRLPDVFLTRTIETVQALALLCAHVRNFPMPEAAWMTGSWAINVAIDMGLHRSIGPWPPRATKDDILRIEMRKRVFWVTFMFMVALSGKLGRPMPLHVGDFDTELPELLTENLERVEVGREREQCSFHGTMYLLKRAKLLCETYGSIYTVEPMLPYEQTLALLERKCRQLKQELPPMPPEEPHLNTESNRSSNMLALIAHRSFAELELVLHHPALCTSKSTDIINKNLTASVEAANYLIRVTVQLMTRNAIDSTWYSTSTFIAAIFTLLFAYEQRNELDSEDLIKLRNDMGVCLEVFGNIGRMLGTGPRLREKMAEIINKALERISRSQTRRGAESANASRKDSQVTTNAPEQSEQQQQQAQPPQQQQQQQQAQPPQQQTQALQQNFKQEPMQNDYQPSQMQQPTGQSAYMLPNEPPVTQHPSTSFVATNQGHYPEQSSVEPVNQYAYSQYTPQSNDYQSMPDMGSASIPTTEAYIYQQGALANSNAWHQWAQAARQQIDSQDYTNSINSAAALMALGRNPSTQAEANHHSAPTHNMGYMNAGMSPAHHLELPNLMNHHTGVPSNIELWSMSHWQPHSRVNQGG